MPQTEDRYLGRDKMHYQNSVWRAFARMWMLLRFPDGRRRSAELGGSNLYFLRYPNFKRAKNRTFRNNQALPAITVPECGLPRKEHCPGPDISFWKVRKLGHPPHPPHPCELALCPRGREFCGQRAGRIRWISAGREPIGSEWYVWIT